MQSYVEFFFSGKTMRGIEHIPDDAGNTQIPVAVLLPGLDGTKCGPQRMFVELSRRMESLGVASIRYDFTGVGDSDGDREDTTLTDHIAETIKILESVREDPRFDNRKVYLFGFSTSAYVASVAESLTSFKLGKLVLLSPVCNMPEIAQRILSSATSNVKYVDYFGHRHTIESWHDWGQPRHKSLAARTDTCPLIINGSRDRLVPASTIQSFCDDVYCGNYIHYVIDEADHAFRRYDQREKVINLTIDFLTQEV